VRALDAPIGKYDQVILQNDSRRHRLGAAMAGCLPRAKPSIRLNGGPIDVRLTSGHYVDRAPVRDGCQLPSADRYRGWSFVRDERLNPALRNESESLNAVRRTDRCAVDADTADHIDKIFPARDRIKRRCACARDRLPLPEMLVTQVLRGCSIGGEQEDDQLWYD
jgi:hypothetical protein